MRRAGDSPPTPPRTSGPSGISCPWLDNPKGNRHLLFPPTQPLQMLLSSDRSCKPDFMGFLMKTVSLYQPPIPTPQHGSAPASVPTRNPESSTRPPAPPPTPHPTRGTPWRSCWQGHFAQACSNSDPRALQRSSFPALLFCLLRPNSSGEGQTARVTAEAAGRVGGVYCAAATEWGPHPQSSGAGLLGGRGRTDGPRRDGGCGCSARVLWVGRLHRDHRCPGPLRLLLDMLFLSVSYFSVRGARPPQRRSRPGEEEGAGPSRTVWPGEGRATGS